MIYTLSLNPAIDYIVMLNDFLAGYENITEKCRIIPGGKGINVATMLHNLDMPCICVGVCAGNVGKMLMDILQQKNLETDFILNSTGETRINIKLITKAGTETEINGQGPILDEDTLNKVINKLSMLSPDDILVLTGSVPQSVPKNIYEQIISQTKCKNIIVDAKGELLLKTLAHHPILIKPNLIELGQYFNTQILNNDQAVHYGKKLIRMGAQNVLISQGEKGAILVLQEGNVLTCPSPLGKVINTVGAGDSMLAAFIHKYLETKDLEAALQFSVCAGSATAFTAGIASKEQVYSLYNNFKY